VRTGCVSVRADAQKFIFLFLFFIYLFIYFYLFILGSCCQLEKRKKINSVFGPQDPQDPRAPWASWVKPREEEGFFSLVPLVTHPSSIPLLGGLIPKFLSLSFQSF
jgi:hypothetical protein